MATQYDDMAGAEQDASSHPDNSHNFKVAGDVVSLPIVPLSTAGPSATSRADQSRRIENAPATGNIIGNNNGRIGIIR